MPPTAPSRCCFSSSTTLSDAYTFIQNPAYRRPLSTTTSLFRQTPSYLTVPADRVPEYPYGRFRTYKQANQGLFAGSKIRFGNVVAEEYGNKSRTTWLPNRHTKRLWSPSLGAFIRTRLTARVLHTIDHLGGIDEYLLGSKAQRIKELGPAGWALRWKIIQTPAVQERFARERAALGLPPKTEGDELLHEPIAGAVLSEVNGMLERGDEFVIGEVQTNEKFVRQDAVSFLKEAKPLEDRLPKS